MQRVRGFVFVVVRWCEIVRVGVMFVVSRRSRGADCGWVGGREGVLVDGGEVGRQGSRVVEVGCVRSVGTRVRAC
jgi:hypothetical protein